MLFGDTVLEVLHHQGNKFRQLFLIQFHTFFIHESGIRFTRDQIDGICKDIRYPNEFFIDLLFDDNQNKDIPMYEDDVARWKNIISDFIIRSYRYTSNKSENKESERRIIKSNEEISPELSDLVEKKKREIVL